MSKHSGPVPRPPFIGNLSVLVDKIRDLASQTEASIFNLLSDKATASRTVHLALSDVDEALEVCRITGKQRERSAELAKAAVILAVRNGATRRAVSSASGISTQTINRWIDEAYEQAAG